MLEDVLRSIRHANYVRVPIAESGFRDGSLVIRDVGPWDHHPTVTNDAEYVVSELVERGMLPGGRRLFYYDSDGNLDEIVVRDGKFAGFRPGPLRQAREGSST